MTQRKGRAGVACSGMACSARPPATLPQTHASVIRHRRARRSRISTWAGSASDVLDEGVNIETLTNFTIFLNFALAHPLMGMIGSLRFTKIA
jgi:hypothetical protein